MLKLVDGGKVSTSVTSNFATIYLPSQGALKYERCDNGRRNCIILIVLEAQNITCNNVLCLKFKIKELIIIFFFLAEWNRIKTVTHNQTCPN